MITDRYYYSTLSLEEKKAYKSLYLAMVAYEKAVVIQKPLIKKIDVQKVIFSVNMDHPLLFYVDFGNLRYSVRTSVISFEIEYYFRKEDALTLQTEIRKVLSKILGKITGRNAYEVVCSAHDVLARNVLYDTKALQNIQSVLLRSNTILGVLFYKTAVCEGIAKTFKYILNMRDIPCIVAVGRASDTKQNPDASELHAWNLVRVDGKNFGVDVTWDINLSQKQLLRHDYLFLSDSMMQRDHHSTVAAPHCVTEGQDFFSQNGLTFRTEKQLFDHLADRLISGNQTAEFRFLVETADPYRAVCDTVARAIAQSFHFQSRISYSVMYNRSQDVFGVGWWSGCVLKGE